jgi:hypothetical protein
MSAYMDALRSACERHGPSEREVLGEALPTLQHILRRTFEPLASHREEEAQRNAGYPTTPPNPVRRVQQLMGAVMGAYNFPLELMNDGIALLSASTPSPPMPAATLMTMYVGAPHGHLHPPSFQPPVTPAPIPLPSLGPVQLGVSLQVSIGGRPAARAGDIGIAITCCGLVPLFEVFTGSSKVFIGGMRAARAADMAKACSPSPGGSMRMMARAMVVAGAATALAGAIADGIDARHASDSSTASALALSAGVNAAQAVADAATAALSATMGSDVAVPPMIGALLPGQFTVLVGGFPIPNLPNPAEALFHFVKARIARSRGENGSHAHAGFASCPA